MKSVYTSCLVLAVLALGVPPSSAQQAQPLQLQTVTLQPTKDNTLYENTMGAVSNGAGAHFFAGLTATRAIRRGLLAFDIAGNVPAGAQIVGAFLTLHVTRTIAGPKNVRLHLVLSDWGEGTSNAPGQEGIGIGATPGDATWIHTFYPSSFWATRGGDFASTASATRPVGSEGAYTWSSLRMALDVQSWLDAPGTNFGWIVIGSEPTSGNATAKRFGSRQGPVGARPSLTIFYEHSPRGACCLADGTCLETTAGGCYALGGTYQGDGTACSPNPCPQPTGACCFLDGSCLELTDADCMAQGGTWQGAFTSCTPDPCPP